MVDGEESVLEWMVGEEMALGWEVLTRTQR